MNRILATFLFCALLLTAAAAAARPVPDVLSVRPVAGVPFHVPEPGERGLSTLDDGWQYVQTILDVDTNFSNWRDSLNAMPVGLDFTHDGRGFLATLHTVFRTTDGGRTWRNMDPFPPPNIRVSEFSGLRSPYFLQTLAARPVARTNVQADTVLLSVIDTATDSGAVHLIYYQSTHRLYPQRITRTPHWLTGIASSDSAIGVGIAGLDGHIFQNDSLWIGVQWEDLSPNKVLIRSGRQDSLNFNETWVGPACSAGPLVVAVGESHWVSRDGGRYWQIRPAADSVFDNAVSFCDSLHGLTGGGLLEPQPQGWVHTTANGGVHWSGRVLQTNLPVRAVASVTPQIAFAAGGDYEQGIGRIWGTRDGGQTWNLELETSADIRVMRAARIDHAHVDVFAAGVYPDLRGGMWRIRLFLPDTTQAVIASDPDTLNFGDLAMGEADTLIATLRNLGTLSDSITGITNTSGAFTALWTFGRVLLNPGDSLALPVVFRSTVPGSFSAYLRLNTQRSGLVEICCRADVASATDPEPPRLLPERLALRIYPNPGNAIFTLNYRVSRAGPVRLCVFDLTGRVVATLREERAAAGEYSLPWDAKGRPSGLYLVRLEAGTETTTQKLLLIK